MIGRKVVGKLFDDISAFGLLATMQSFQRFFGSGLVALQIPSLGKITIRRKDSDFETLRQCFQSREYDYGNDKIAERVEAAYQVILAGGHVPVIIDAGANIGAASIWFNRRYPAAKIVAVEPEPGNVTLLRMNTKVRSAITVVEAAIGASPGHVAINNTGHAWAATTERADSGCPIVTMDQAIALIDHGILLLAKIDIEGFEKDLFAENLGWLDHVTAVFIEPHDWKFPDQNTSRTFQEAMAAREFQVLLCGENLLYVRAPTPVAS